MQVVAHNLLSQFTNRQLNISTKSKGKSAEKLSAGYKINRAADDAAGLQMSEKMRSQIRGLNRGEKNTQEGISWVQVADGAMNEMMEITQRIRELAVQAANDTNSQDERNAIDNEIKELRKEINMISTNTEFNKQKVFDNSGVTIDVKGEFNDLAVYNATYDDATGQVTYGGFIFGGYRVPWDSVSQDMVSLDANGEQVFNGGSYVFQEPNTGTKFQLVCEPGAQVPKITREYSISANAGGIMIDGVRHGWDEMRDMDGNPPNGKFTEGAWELEHNGVTLTFLAGKEMDYSKMAEEVNKSSTRYTWKMDYIGKENVQAVDASLIENLRLSNNTVAMMQNDKLAFRVRADQTGIWLENIFTNSEVANSKQTWASIGIDDKDWKEGNKINKNITYTYSDSEGVNDTYIAFDLVLDEVTSMDSVLDGLDGMEIGGGPITNHYGAVPDVQLDQNILSAYVNGGDQVLFSEEKEFGRDFDQKTKDPVSYNQVAYDPITKKIQLDFPDMSGSNNGVVISYKGSTQEMENYLKGDLSTFLSSIMAVKKNQALNPGTVVDIKAPTLRDVLGKDKVTPDGYLSETISLREDMLLTDGEKGFEKGEFGETYPAALIDFSAIGNGVDIMKLVGTGFNSDCKTCDNFYSIRFEDFSKGGTVAEKETAEGYRYTIREVDRPNSNRSNYTLQLDLNSLVEQGITDGESLAAALISITSECLDMHYTQYAADGSKFYIYDNRPQNTGAPSAAFDAIPLPQVNVDELSFRMSTDDGMNREINMLFKYDYSDVSDWVQYHMNQDPNGNYVYRNGVDDTDGYRLYTPADGANADRFTMVESYVDAAGNPLASTQEIIDKYAEFAMNKLMGNTNVSLNALDYTYMEVSGEEKQNIAVKSVFETVFDETGDSAVIHIQNSSIVHDSVKLPRFQLNEVVLNLHKAGTKDYAQSQATIAMADDAVRILSGKRSIYGAWQNRLEFIYANSCNMEENAQASESRIRDTDMADEMVKYSKHSILEQAGQALLAKSNHSMEGVLSLLGGN